jgi:metal-dependent amidase/aminoacylase/carboxypeptidase family protein
VTVGSIHGGTAANVIPPEVLLKGTIRSMNESVRRQLWEELRKSLELSRALGGDFKLEIRPGFPVLSNDAATAGLIRQVAMDLLGEDNVHRETAEMGAEDFSILASEAPGAMFSLGVKRPGSERTLQLHSPDFDVDEEALPVGAAILAEASRRYLVGGNG